MQDDMGEAGYTEVQPSQAPVEVPLFACSPSIEQPEPPYSADPAMGESWVGRMQPALGWGEGSYALNSQADAGSPVAMPDAGLPGLRDGEYLFSRRLLGPGDQGMLDRLEQVGGSYLEVQQPPYYEENSPLGR